jgi:hypothetical protein
LDGGAEPFDLTLRIEPFGVAIYLSGAIGCSGADTVKAQSTLSALA